MIPVLTFINTIYYKTATTPHGRLFWLAIKTVTYLSLAIGLWLWKKKPFANGQLPKKKTIKLEVDSTTDKHSLVAKPDIYTQSGNDDVKLQTSIVHCRPWKFEMKSWYSCQTARFLRTWFLYPRLDDIAFFHILQGYKKIANFLNNTQESRLTEEQNARWLCVATESDVIYRKSAPTEVSGFQ